MNDCILFHRLDVEYEANEKPDVRILLEVIKRDLSRNEKRLHSKGVYHAGDRSTVGRCRDALDRNALAHDEEVKPRGKLVKDRGMK